MADEYDDMFADIPTDDLDGMFADIPITPARSKSESVLRGLKMFGRVALEGSAKIATGAADLVGGAGNLVGNTIGRADAALSGREYEPQQFFPTNNTQYLEGQYNQFMPSPENRTEEMAYEAIEAGIGSLAVPGAGQLMQRTANPVTARVGQILSQSPAMQAGSVASGSVASNVAEDRGAGPVGQTVAGVAGSLAPGAGALSLQAAGRGMVRGGGGQAVQENIDSFTRAGTTPSVGQATESRALRAAENLLAKTPGGAGRMAKESQRQADDLAAGIEARAQQLAGKTSAETTGRRIVEGVDDFVTNKFRVKQGQLYDELDNWIDPALPVSVSNTQQQLSRMTTPIQGAEATSGRLVNSKLKQIADDLGVDAADGNLPFAALKQLRTWVGEKLSTVGLADDISKAEWKQLYGALSDDMREAAKIDPKAYQAWQRANTYTRAGHKRIEVLDRVVNKNGGMEKVFAAATSGTKEGATVLRTVMQSLDTAGQKAITATVLRRMGLATPGKQNALGDQFSTETFLTNWNKLSPEAKSTLFNRYSPGFRKDMDAVAKVSANLREGSEVFRNPSGTAQAGIQYTTAGAFGMAVLTGNYTAAGLIAAGAAGANRVAALMTNPQFVKWLARSSEMPAGAIPAQISNLARMAKEEGDEDMAWGAALLEEAYNEANQ